MKSPGPMSRLRLARVAGALLGLHLALTTGVVLAKAPVLPDLIAAEQQVRAARDEVRRATFGLPAEEAQLAAKIIDAIDDGDVTLEQLGDMSRRIDLSASDSARRSLDEQLRAALDEARPRVCSISLSYVNRAIRQVRSESLLVPVRRARDALAQACAMLQGHPMPGAVGMANELRGARRNRVQARHADSCTQPWPCLQSVLAGNSKVARAS